MTITFAVCGHETSKKIALYDRDADYTIAWFCPQCRTIEMVERWDSPDWRTRALEIAQWAEERNDE